jgi:hypothetical protein
MTELHGGPSGGHLRVNKSLSKFQQRYYWLQAERYTCIATRCQRGQIEGSPFDRIAINVAGLFPRCYQGNRYLLIAMDYFTKWSEAYATPNQEVSTVLEALVTNFCHFGVPWGLRIDQGHKFESRVIQEVLERLRVNEPRTTSLHPQSDGRI